MEGSNHERREKEISSASRGKGKEKVVKGEDVSLGGTKEITNFEDAPGFD